VEHGWLRSRWSCKLACLQLLREQLAEVSRETVRRRLLGLGFRYRRPRPVPPEKDSEQQIEHRQTRLEDVLQMTEQEPGSFFQDETKLETNPKVGFCWMRKGKQRPLRTPGTNRKVWISGALNFKTGRLHCVSGGHRDSELFIRLLEKLRRTYRCHRQLHLAVDNDGSHLSKRVRKYVQDSGGRLNLHPLPSWSPGSNPVELVVVLARGGEAQPRVWRIRRSGEAYRRLSCGEAALQVEARRSLQPSGEGDTLSSGECPFISWSYLVPLPSRRRGRRLGDGARIFAETAGVAVLS
jgi:hypothetical protein